MILPDPGQEDIPIEINPRRLLPLSPYFKQLTAIATVLVLTVGLGLAVKLSQENQDPFKKAGGVPIVRVDLSVNEIDSAKYGLSAQAVGDSANEASYQWGVSSTNSIGNLNIHSSQKYAEFTLNGNEGRADIWVTVDGGTSNSYAIAMGPDGPYIPTPVVPNPGPINWNSRSAWFKADYLYFTLGAKDVDGRIFAGRPDPGTTFKIDDVSTDKLTVSWTEFGTPLTLSIFYNSVPEFDSEKINYAVSQLIITDGVVTDTYKPVWTTRGGYPYESTKEEALLPIKQSHPDLVGALKYKNAYWFPGLYSFSDLNNSQWSWKHVQKILPTRIMTPVFDGLFAPTQEITRSDMALFLARAYEYITQKKALAVDTPFTDISLLSPEVQDAIKKIYGLKITAGTGTSTYSPDTKVNRAQMATFLSNLYKAVTGDFALEVPVPFTDIYNEDIKWAQKPIARIYGLKVTAGISPTEFGPYLVTTREQMATFIMNFIEAVARLTLPPPASTPQICAQVLTPARNNVTQECRIFGDSCLPDGWVADRSCQISTPAPEPSPTTKTDIAKPTVTPILVDNLTSSISAITQRLLIPTPIPVPSVAPVPNIYIPPTASPQTANIFIQLLQLLQDFFAKIF